MEDGSEGQLLIVRVTPRQWNQTSRSFETLFNVVERFTTPTEAEGRLAELRALEPQTDFRIVRNEGLL